MGMYSLPESGSHFFLAARAVNNDNLAGAKCPSILAFASLYGAKRMFVLPEGSLDDLSGHHLGTANLSDIFKVEDAVEPIGDA